MEWDGFICQKVVALTTRCAVCNSSTSGFYMWTKLAPQLETDSAGTEPSSLSIFESPSFYTHGAAKFSTISEHSYRQAPLLVYPSSPPSMSFNIHIWNLWTDGQPWVSILSPSSRLLSFQCEILVTNVFSIHISKLVSNKNSAAYRQLPRLSPSNWDVGSCIGTVMQWLMLH